MSRPTWNARRTAPPAAAAGRQRGVPHPGCRPQPRPENPVAPTPHAARAEITAGAPGQAQLLLDRARDHLRDRLQDGLAKLAQGAIYHALNQPAEAAAVLLAAAGDLAPLDVRLARAALLDALTAAAVCGPLALTGATDLDIAAAASALPLAAGQAPGIGDLLLDADAALVLDGHRAAAPLVRRRFLPCSVIGRSRRRCWPGSKRCRAAEIVGDDVALHALASRMERQARRQGVSALAVALVYSGTSDLFAGSLGEAQARFTEREAIEAARGSDCRLGNLLVMAWRGRERETRAGASAVADATRSRARAGSWPGSTTRSAC